MRFFILSLLFTLTLSANNKVALVIGNKNYTNQTGLNNPIKDAKLIRDTLHSMGFEVLEAYNKDLNGLGNKLDKFIAKARNTKVAVVYYAGHGIGVGGRNYLIPIGVSNLSVDNLGRKLMSVDELKGAVAKAKGFGVVLFDACRNSFFSGTIAGLSSGRGSRALVQPTVKRGQNILVSFSTKAGEIAKDDVNNGEHSPYALALRDNLTEREDIRLVMGGVKDSVATLTNNQQEPISENSLGRKKACLAGCGYVPPTPTPTPKPTPTSKWIKPTNSVCRANGGKIDKYGCFATWENAKKICLASGGQLPSRDDFHKVITDCGGIVDANSDEWDKNRNNNHYQYCCKQKGFTRWVYWTREEKNSSSAWGVFFKSGLGDWLGKSNNFLALCVR